MQIYMFYEYMLLRIHANLCVHTHTPVSVTVAMSVGISKHLFTSSTYSHAITVSI